MIEISNSQKLKKRAVSLISLFLVYSLSKEYFYVKNPEVYLLFKILFWIGLLLIIGFFESLRNDFAKNSSTSSSQHLKIKYRGAILILWILAVLSAQNVGWIAENIDGGTIVFVSFIPILWLFKINHTIAAKIALVLLLFTGVFASHYRPTAEVFAQITYLWLAVSVIMKIREDIYYV